MDLNFLFYGNGKVNPLQHAAVSESQTPQAGAADLSLSLSFSLSLSLSLSLALPLSPSLSLARSLARSPSLSLSLARALSLFYVIAHHALPLTHPDMHLELLDEFAVFPRVNVSVAVSIKDRGKFK